MFRNSLLFLALLANCGGGVGLSYLCEQSGLSKFKARKVLKELLSCGAIIRVKNKYHLALLGACITQADTAAAQGYTVGYSDTDDYMPKYQKGF